jgi:hypothetical protein
MVYFVFDEASFFELLLDDEEDEEEDDDDEDDESERIFRFRFSGVRDRRRLFGGGERDRDLDLK